MSTDSPAVDLDRDWRQRAAETRARQGTKTILDATELALLTRLATQPSKPLSQLRMSELCKEAGIVRTTMLRRFKTVEEVGAAVAERMRAEGRAVPAQLADLAERHARDVSWKYQAHPEQNRLLARISSKHPTIEELQAGYTAALTRMDATDDPTEIIYWCTELTEACFANCQRENLRLSSKPLDDRARGVVLGLAHQALDYAEHGLGFVDVDNDDHCMLGFRLTQTAARAELLVSTKQLEYETTGLSRIRSLKDLEIVFARRLGWQLKAELARFHRDRSAALCDDRVGPEIVSIREITATLLRMCEHTAAQGRPPMDTLPADELSGVISRLCAIEMAYSRADNYAAIYRRAFPHGADEVKEALLACYSTATGDDIWQQQRDIIGLIRLQKLGIALEEAESAGTDLREVIQEYEDAPLDLLRSARFGIIRHLLVARYLAAKARMKIGHKPDEAGDPDDGSIIDASSIELLEAAIYFYDYAQAVTRRRGAGGTLRNLAMLERQHLALAHPEAREDTYMRPEPIPDEEFKQYQQAINDLVLKGFTWRTRLSGTQVEALQDQINPVGRYLGRGQR
ncbi:hypothetical protein ACWIGI_04220 [Nocardia sp. NPDC055321]